MIAWCWLVSPVVVTARLPLPVCSIRPWLLSVSVVRLTCPALRVPVFVVVVLRIEPCERALISPLLVKLHALLATGNGATVSDGIAVDVYCCTVFGTHKAGVGEVTLGIQT